MRLEITIIYADGRHQDVLTHSNLSASTASKRAMDVLEKMQNCINDRRIFYASNESNRVLVAVGPEALARAHFKCEYLEDDAPQRV